MSYDDFTIYDALEWLKDIAPDLLEGITPVDEEDLEPFEALFEGDPPEQVVEFLEELGDGTPLPFSRTWQVSIDAIRKAYAARPWLGEKKVSMWLVQLGYKKDARQYDLFLQGPFYGGHAGTVVAMESLSQEDARAGEARPAWTVAGSLPELVCLPVFVERVVEAGSGTLKHWRAQDGEYDLLSKTRAALEACGFVAEPFSTDEGAALRRGSDAVALMEQHYPMEVIASGASEALSEIAAALSDVGAFDIM